MSSSTSFPLRVFIQQFDASVPPDYKVVAEELSGRGIPVLACRNVPGDLTKDDLVVGDFSWTREALKQLGIPMPSPPDYPDCLRHLLHRRVWQSTLGQVRAFLKSNAHERPAQVFIKPAVSP